MKVNKQKVLYILQEFKKQGKIDEDWDLMKMRLHLLMWNIDKEFFFKAGKEISGFTYVRRFVPMVKNYWFERTIKNLYSDLYNTNDSKRGFLYSKELAKKIIKKGNI